MMMNRIGTFLQRLKFDPELVIFALIYFALSITALMLKLHSAPGWYDGTLLSNHQKLMAFQYTNNEQSRLLQFLVPELLHRITGLYIENSYALARLTFVFFAFLAFHFFLRRWFDRAESFAGGLILFSALPVAIMISDIQESAPLLMLMFILCLWAIRERKDFLFSVFLLIGGGLTNETLLAIAVGYFLVNLQSFKFPDLLRTGFRTFWLSLPAILAQGLIRYFTRHQAHLGGAFHLPDNLNGIWKELTHPVTAMHQGFYIYPLLLFSIFWFLALLGYPRSPVFLRRMFWMVPLFVFAHLIMGIIYEARQMVPLGFIIIPMSLFFIFSKANPEELAA